MITANSAGVTYVVHFDETSNSTGFAWPFQVETDTRPHPNSIAVKNRPEQAVDPDEQLRQWAREDSRAALLQPEDALPWRSQWRSPVARSGRRRAQTRGRGVRNFRARR